MNYEGFEDLPAWQDAIRLAEECENFLAAAGDRITPTKRDQLDRCSLAVSSHVAEAYERSAGSGSVKAVSRFDVACGAAGEVRSILGFLERRPALADFRDQIANLKLLAESCSQQPRKWMEPTQPVDKNMRRFSSRSRNDWDTVKSPSDDPEVFGRLD